jgi:hypothetical protein
MRKALGLILVLSACSPVVNSSNTIILDKTGESRGQANVSFSTFNGKNGKMTLVTTDGEIYNGNVIGEKSERGDDMFDEGARFYSKARAVLISNRGHSMKCNFDIAEPSLGVTSGAIGECKSSTGWIVPISMSGRSKKIS